MQLSSLSYYLIAKTNSLFLSPSREYAVREYMEEVFPDSARKVGIWASDRSTSLTAPGSREAPFPLSAFLRKVADYPLTHDSGTLVGAYQFARVRCADSSLTSDSVVQLLVS